MNVELATNERRDSKPRVAGIGEACPLDARVRLASRNGGQRYLRNPKEAEMLEANARRQRQNVERSEEARAPGKLWESREYKISQEGKNIKLWKSTGADS